MVCKKCEKKLAKLACPDKWKDGATNTMNNKDMRKSAGKDKRLSMGKNRFDPLAKKCVICKNPIHQAALYCHACAYKKGICANCGKQQLDTSKYRMTTT